MFTLGILVTLSIILAFIFLVSMAALAENPDPQAREIGITQIVLVLILGVLVAAMHSVGFYQ